MESVIATREEVERFLSVAESSGSGFGYGSSPGSGNDYGSGYGIGSGLGACDRYGRSYCSFDGSDDGYGDGYGSGYGYKYGSGSGDGSCDIKCINGCSVDFIDGIATIIAQVKGNFAKGYIVRKDLTFAPCFVAKVGNSFAHGETIQDAFKDAQNKELKWMPVEEIIAKFINTFGSIDSLHKGKEYYDWHHILTGSCTMGRDVFCKAHSIDMDADYTVKYFLDITKDSYGGDIIKSLIDSYKEIKEE